MKKQILIFAAALALTVLFAGRVSAEATTATTTQPAGDQIELKLKFPRPMFEGTPANIKSDNLEKVDPKAKPQPVMVPKGTELLSLNKPVKSSDEFPIIGEIAQVTDGDKEGSDGSFLELGPGVQWVQVDLEKSAKINAVAVWHYHSQARVYRDIVIQISDDPDFVDGVTTVYNNDHDNSAGLGIGSDKEYIESNRGRLVTVKGVKGRYVRLSSNGNTSDDQNHYIEVEVYGEPVK